MKIGIDIDEVLVDFVGGFLDFFNGKYGGSLKKEDCGQEVRFHEFLGISKEASIGLFKEFDKHPGSKLVEVIEGAREGIEELSKNHEIILITARPKDIEGSTRELLECNFPGVKFNILFLGMSHSTEKKLAKAKTCIDENVDIMIDDDSDNAMDCAGNGIRCFLFDKPWNRNVKHEKISRVLSWKEIVEKIREMGDKNEE